MRRISQDIDPKKKFPLITLLQRGKLRSNKSPLYPPLKKRGRGDLEEKITKQLLSVPALVTGGNGFIGSHLVKRLKELKAAVGVLSPPRIPKPVIDFNTDNIEFFPQDLLDYSGLKNVIKKFRPKVVYHLAAEVNVQRNIESAKKTFEVNIMGALNLISALSDSKIDCLVNTGTCEEYGDGDVPFNEEQRERPVSPYSVSKVANTYFCSMLYRTAGFPIVTLRPFLTYGPGQSLNMFIPSLIQSCLKNEDFKMTTGEQGREFNYVDDIVEGYILAGTTPAARGHIINIGNGKEYRIVDVARKIVEMTGSTIKLRIGAIPCRKGETRHFYCSNRKARELLGWRPRVDLDTGLARTIAWYRQHI